MSHTVPSNQYEPGVAQEQQAMTHAQTLDLLNTDLTVSYVFTQRVELSLAIPLRLVRSSVDFLDQAGRKLNGFESIHHRNETITGVDDLRLEVRHRLLTPASLDTLRLDVKYGISFPVAAIEPDPFELGRRGRRHQHVFFGTGTFDPLAAVQIEYGFGEFVLGGETEWTGSLYANRYGYRGPISLTQRVAIGSSFGTTTWFPSLGTELFKEFPARWSNEVAENSGRLEVSPMVALRAAATRWVSVMASVKKPFILSAQSTTLHVPLIVMLSVQTAVDTHR
ncbi:MAG: hypothetical protein VYA30_16585 [Myxococcota bacterium]|nr:hypothetical protein [Myxococcota bacterium]